MTTTIAKPLKTRFKIAPLSAVIFSLFTLPSMSIAHTTPEPEDLDDLAEVIKVTGRRNQANSEMTEATEQLMSIAGVANDPLTAVYSLLGILYAGVIRDRPR